MNPGFFSRVILLLAFLSTGVILKAQVSADFTATPTSGCSPLIVRFSDASTGNPNQWMWDLGNGTISFLQNPSAAYFAPGKYTIKLVARNANSEDSVVKVEYVEVFAKPAINFSVSATTGCYPLPVNFTDITVAGSSSITSWLWDFGDGATSTDQNPSHVYTSANNFNVTLQVRNSAGCVSTLTKASLIQINTGVLAQFDKDFPLTCKAPVIINFQNQSTGTGVVNYLWDFGDGTTSNLINPTHSYTANGSYTIKLAVTNSNGCTDTIVKPNEVTVGTVDALFTNPAVLCQGSNIIFTNTSVPAPAYANWNYGDGSTGSDLNGSHTYTNAGSYNVKLVANFGACTDSITKVVSVLSKPTAAFSTADTTSCKAPFTVNFTSQSANAVSYRWDFGDNTSSAVQNPSHTYTSTGSYTVKLVATNANGCSDSLIRTNYINIRRPVASISNVPDSGCTPFPKTFHVSVNIADPISSYNWNFGDGNTSTDAIPTHSFAAEGIYNISVIVITASGCTDTARVPGGVVANNKPTAGFSATPLSTCAQFPVTFSDLSTGGATRWLWEFGDSTRSTMQNPSHQYRDTGYFDIKLRVWRGGCMDTFLINDYVRINPPIANFRVSNDCKRPFEKIFTDQSIGAEEWHWDFGDGTTSTTQSPSHIYTATGLYTVTLRVVNNTYGCEYTTAKQLQILNAKAQFSTPDTAVCKGSTVSFTTGLSLTDISSLNWNFGDLTPSINSPGQSTGIDHVFNTSGIFTVRLIVNDKNGCADTMIKPRYISVSGPVARFSPGAAGSCLNSAVVFTDSTSSDGIHPIQQWQWQYGDNTTEILSAPPFQHLYAAAGSYVVKLKVTDSKGCTDSTTLPAALTISSPRANFTTIDTFSCPGKPVRFVNQSTGPSLQYHWSFGDGAVSTSAAPSHAYTADGTYSVTLVITDMYGCGDSITRTDYVTIISPLSRFSLSDSLSNCPPLVVNFTNYSTGAESIRWDFGDSTYSTSNDPTHFYNYPGTYYAKLTVTGKGGCISTYQKKILVKGPEGQFTYNPLGGCNPVTVNFSAFSNGRNSFVWDFSDGTTITSRDSILSHTYTYPGRYVPKMILIDQTGCQVPITGHDTILVSEVINNFNFNHKLLCDSGMVSFTDSSSFVNGDNIVLYQWNFGDGNVSNTQNPVHQYLQTGIYYPQLITSTRQGCTDTLRSAVPVKIVASPNINILSSGSGCTPLDASFNAQLTVPDTSAITWQWNFGNGSTATGTSPSVQHYTTPGIHTIALTGTNSSGCKDTASITVESYPIPAVNAGADFLLCKGSSKTLEASGADTYSWSPATALSCTNCATPVTTTTGNITYTVTGRSAQGCSASDSISISVKDKLRITHSNNDSVCAGSSKKLHAAGANSYVWTPSAGLDNSNISEPTATPASSTTYTVIGSDDVGCFKDTGYINITVNPLPTVEAGIDKTINVGSMVDLVPVISNDVNNVIWQPTTGLFRNYYPGITVKPMENTEYTVQVKNRSGCEARDRVTVFVICNGSNIYMPNTFSPNGDGTNDVFYPRGTGLFKVKSMRIFTRWGEVVFEKTNFDANNPAYGWDGTKKGQKVTPDVFVYSLELVCDNGSVLTYRGNISVIK